MYMYMNVLHVHIINVHGLVVSNVCSYMYVYVPEIYKFVIIRTMWGV